MEDSRQCFQACRPAFDTHYAERGISKRSGGISTTLGIHAQRVSGRCW